MLPEARAAFNLAKREERARAFGANFGWKISVAGFPLDALSPPGAAARGRSGGGQAIRDRDAGLEHYEYYREGRRSVAIVGQPYAPAFECGKREGVVAQVERERGTRILELDPCSPDASSKRHVVDVKGSRALTICSAAATSLHCDPSSMQFIFAGRRLVVQIKRQSPELLDLGFFRLTIEPDNPSALVLPSWGYKCGQTY